MASTLSGVLTSHGYNAEQVSWRPLTFDRDPRPAAIVLCVLNAAMSALYVLVSARKAAPPIPVVVLIGPGQARIAVEALKLGAAEVVVMPARPEDLLSILRASQQKAEETADGRSKTEYPKQPAADAAVFVSNSSTMSAKWKVACTVARTDLPVLIHGESGTGKEVLARFIHRQSRRADKPFVKVSCAAIPHDLLESELFGYEKGAFTGAHRRKPGQFEYANKGRIHLDEIAELPLALQAKLLHVLQDFRFSRVGGHGLIDVDARVIAATNRDLEHAMARSEFREDLYYRLNVVEIRIPPLRERKEEIPLLASSFLSRFNAQYGRTKQLSSETMARLSEHSWSGNVRELENVILRMVVLTDGEQAFEALLARCRNGHAPTHRTAPLVSEALKEIARRGAGDAERKALVEVLDRVQWNRAEASRILKVSYKTLLNKIAECKLSPPSQRRF